MTLKAWQINEYDVYAAETMDEAVAAAVWETGCTQDEIYDDLYARELQPQEIVHYVDGPVGDEKTTIGEMLKGVTKPWLLFGLED
jgi:hypothetical protein